jgi:hypothetical protein
MIIFINNSFFEIQLLNFEFGFCGDIANNCKILSNNYAKDRNVYVLQL